MARGSRRLGIAIALSLTLGLLTISTALAGKPTPTKPYATISVDSKCRVSLVTAWTDPAVGYIYAFTYVDGAYLWTQDAPGTGPNAGTFDPVSMTATWMSGSLAKTRTDHTFSALVTLNASNGGAFIDQYSSNTVTARCAVGA